MMWLKAISKNGSELSVLAVPALLRVSTCSQCDVGVAMLKGRRDTQV